MNKTPERLEQQVMNMQAIKDHPKLKNIEHLLHDPQNDRQVAKLKKRIRKKYAPYADGEDENQSYSDIEEKKVQEEAQRPLSRQLKIEKLISGELPRKTPNIARKNAKLMRARQSLKERMRPIEFDQGVLKSVL